MYQKPLRLAIMVSVLLTTIAAFVYYFAKHPSVGDQLRHTPPGLLLLILALYAVQIVIIGLTLLFTLRLCDTRLHMRESLLLTMYTVVINFFGPLQSGPAFRGVYLRQKHGLKLRNYTLATFVYLGLYALFSGLFLLSGLLKWWLLIGVVIAVLAALWLQRSEHKLAARLRQLHLRSLGLLSLATLLQVGAIAAIYYTELRAVDPGVGVNQAVVYTGAANFALFVALTPGAIGFRETFLLFSRRLHHIGSSTIVAANVIDRSVYIILLLLLAVAIFGTHAREQLRTKPSGPTKEPATD